MDLRNCDNMKKTAAMYMKETEMKNNLPTLFDMLVEEKAIAV